MAPCCAFNCAISRRRAACAFPSDTSPTTPSAATVLSRRGYEKIQQIMEADELLRVNERSRAMFGRDRGIDRQGQPKATFEAGVDIHARVTIFCDGVRGNLTKQLHRRLQIGRGRQPEQFAVVRPFRELDGDARPGVRELAQEPGQDVASDVEEAVCVLVPGVDLPHSASAWLVAR